MIDYGIPLLQNRPDVRLFQLGGEIKIIVIPKRLDGRSIAWRGKIAAADVGERGYRMRRAPVGLIENAVDFDFSRNAADNITRRIGKEPRMFLDQRPRRLSAERRGRERHNRDGGEFSGERINPP